MARSDIYTDGRLHFVGLGAGATGNESPEKLDAFGAPRGYVKGRHDKELGELRDRILASQPESRRAMVLHALDSGTTCIVATPDKELSADIARFYQIKQFDDAAEYRDHSLEIARASSLDVGVMVLDEDGQAAPIAIYRRKTRRPNNVIVLLREAATEDGLLAGMAYLRALRSQSGDIIPRDELHHIRSVARVKVHPAARAAAKKTLADISRVRFAHSRPSARGRPVW